MTSGGWKVDRWRERVVRGSHRDVCEGRGGVRDGGGGHFSPFIDSESDRPDVLSPSGSLKRGEQEATWASFSTGWESRLRTPPHAHAAAAAQSMQKWCFIAQEQLQIWTPNHIYKSCGYLVAQMQFWLFPCVGFHHLMAFWREGSGTTGWPDQPLSHTCNTGGPNRETVVDFPILPSCDCSTPIYPMDIILRYVIAALTPR